MDPLLPNSKKRSYTEINTNYNSNTTGESLEKYYKLLKVTDKCTIDTNLHVKKKK